MNKKRKNLFFVDAEGLVEDVDFEVITETEFNEEAIEQFFEIENHTYNLELATILGLGVVKNYHTEDDYYLYHASKETKSYDLMEEMVRISVYYQITHPEYDDRFLEKFLMKDESGREFLQWLQAIETDMPYQKLEEIFAGKKRGEVLEFREVK